MAQTNPLVATNSAAASSDIVVTAAAPVTLSAYTTDGAGTIVEGTTPGFQMNLLIKVGAAYQQFCDENRKPVILTTEKPNHYLNRPGTFRVIKSATAGVTLGVYQDA